LTGELGRRKRLGLPVETGVFVLLALLSGWLMWRFPQFRTTANLDVVITTSAIYAIVAAGMTMVIATGGIDISVGSVLGFAATVLLTLTGRYGWGLFAASCAALMCGIGCGCVNGVLIALLRVPPIVATLATLSAARASAYIVAYIIGPQSAAGRLPESFSNLYFGKWMGLPSPGWIGAVALISAAVILKHAAFGRGLLALGGNRATAFMSGLSVRRTELAVYMLSGLLAGVASIIVAAREGSVNPDAGKYLELSAITAVVVGGTPISGGRATVIGTLLGVLTISVVSNGVISYGLTGLWQPLVLGFVLLATVEVDRWRMRRTARPADSHATPKLMAAG
jgi:ribose/xylose/arabinose/galactoside ABC-type transport system permease subunit